MKCSKCQAEWTLGNASSQPTSCPFCGALLVVASAINESRTMQDVMVQIVERFGEEILSQESKCMAAFKDFAPTLEKEQKILKIAFGEGIADYFLRCPVAERDAHMEKALQNMSALLSDEASLLVVNSFAAALGWNISGMQWKQDVPAQNDRQVPQPKKTKRTETTDTPPKAVSEDEANKMYQEGESCYEKNQYGEAMKWYLKAADAGNAEAMSRIGDMYFWGLGVAEDDEDAMKWYRKAVDAGNADAMYFIGRMYADGCGVAENREEAMKRFRKAEDAGSIYMQF